MSHWCADTPELRPFHSWCPIIFGRRSRRREPPQPVRKLSSRSTYIPRLIRRWNKGIWFIYFLSTQHVNIATYTVFFFSFFAYRVLISSSFFFLCNIVLWFRFLILLSAFKNLKILNFFFQSFTTRTRAPLHIHARHFGFRRFVHSMELSSVNCSPRDQIVPDSCNGNNWATEQLDFNWQMQVSHERIILS